VYQKHLWQPNLFIKKRGNIGIPLFSLVNYRFLRYNGEKKILLRFHAGWLRLPETAEQGFGKYFPKI